MPTSHHGADLPGQSFSGPGPTADEDRHWLVGAHGFELDAEMAREESFCAWAIQRPGELFVLPDASTDPRFRENPRVAGEPQLRFYAGMPICTLDGQPVGTVAVLDRAPRDGLRDEQAEARGVGPAVPHVRSGDRPAPEYRTDPVGSGAGGVNGFAMSKSRWSARASRRWCCV